MTRPRRDPKTLLFRVALCFALCLAAHAGEYRKLDVIPRRTGLRVRSRRGYVARTPSS